MRTDIIYGDVLLKDVLTDTIEHIAHKDSSGVDQLGVEVTVSGTAVVHVAAQDQIGIRVGTSSSAFPRGLSSLLQSLTKDRQRFVMRCGGRPIYDVIPGAREPEFRAAPPVTGQLIDINHGPIPQITVLKITAGVSAHIRFQFKFTMTNCGGFGKARSDGLLLFRFWMAENINCQNWLATRRYEGFIRVASQF